MGHQVKAFVGARPILDLVQRQFELSRVIELKQNVAILPLTDELYDAVPGDLAAVSELKFVLLTPKIVALLIETSTYGVIGYFETDYFCGNGTQGAILAKNGQVIFGPRVRPDSINQILALMDVSTSGAHDEFDAVGLGRFRDNTDWINQPSRGRAVENLTLTDSLISWVQSLGKK